MKHIKKLLPTCQVPFNPRELDHPLQIGSIVPEVSSDAYSYFSPIATAKREFINFLFNQSAEQESSTITFHVSQAQGAMGCHRTHVPNVMRWAKSIGLIDYYRKNGYCKILINEWLLSHQTKSLLRSLFKALCFIPLFFLVNKCYPQYKKSFLMGQLSAYIQGVKGYKYNNYNKFIAPEIQEVRSLGLTKAGMVFLSAFPAECVAEVDDHVYWCDRLRNRWNYFVSCCLRWCKDRGITPSWRYMYLLRPIYGVVRGDDMVKSESQMIREVFADSEDQLFYGTRKRSYESPKMDKASALKAVARINEERSLPPDESLVVDHKKSMSEGIGKALSKNPNNPFLLMLAKVSDS